MGQPADVQERYHAFDALRGVMMLLGVVLHSCQYYVTATLTPGMLFQDNAPSPACDVALLGIHTFRMHVFFVMAGFFAALLVDRRGASGMLNNRFRRVGLPLALGWLILFPPTISAFLYGCARRAGVPAGEAVLAWWRTGNVVWVDGWSRWYNLFLIGPLHLWFLYALLWFYLGALAVRWFGSLGKGGVGRGVNRAYRGLLTSGLLLPGAACGTFLTLLLNPVGLFPQEFPMFFPNPLALLSYGPFFGFGWLLFRNADLLPRFRRPFLALAAAAALFPVYLGRLEGLGDPSRVAAAKPVIAATGSAIAWLCVFGFIGLFLRYFRRPSPAMRYLADSAYWVYLAHLPLVYGMQGLLYGLPVPGTLKALAILAVVSAALLATYDRFVRPSAIGAFLNGRRYPPALPALFAGAGGASAAN